MSELPLPALEGTNPLGLLAALGVLDALSRTRPGATLRWTDELVPHAVIAGPEDLEELVTILDHDREQWNSGPLLGFPQGSPLPDAKPPAHLLRQWFTAAYATHRAADADLLCAIVSEGALDGKKNAKPTHLHFTAGQQRFLHMARELRDSVNAELLRQAVTSWRYVKGARDLRWDAQGDRVYGLRARNPENDNETKRAVPGAQWLAFRGLSFYPVHTSGGALRTTACDPAWKRSSFRWPLWRVPITRNVAASLVADPTLVSRTAAPGPRDLAARGILCILQAPIRRTDQGGYGSFGGPEILTAAVPD